MKFLFDSIILTYPGAIFIFFFGLYNLKKTLNDQDEKYSYIRASSILNGVIFSIGCIVFGILVFLLKIMNKF